VFVRDIIGYLLGSVTVWYHRVIKELKSICKSAYFDIKL